MDAKLIFQLFMYACTLIGFCIIKFNDFAHLEKNVNDLKHDIKEIESKQDKRHDENLKQLSKLESSVSYLCGRQYTKKK